MSVETAFYIVGLSLMAAALLVSFAGLKLKGFPSRGALTGIMAVFVALVVATCGLAVAVAREEQDHRRHEQAQAAKEAEEPADSATADGAEGAGADDAQDAAGEGAAGDSGQPASDSAEGAGGTVALAADTSTLAYNKTELESAPGEVTIDFENPSPIPHDVVVRGEDGEDIGGTEVITESQASVTLDLPAGEYQFYCSVPGHEQAGMVGTLKVG